MWSQAWQHQGTGLGSGALPAWHGSCAKQALERDWSTRLREDNVIGILHEV